MNFICFVCLCISTKLRGPSHVVKSITEGLEGLVTVLEAPVLSIEDRGRIIEFDLEEADLAKEALQILIDIPENPLEEKDFSNFEKITDQSELDKLKEGRISFAIIFTDKKLINTIEVVKECKIFISTDQDLAKKLNTPFPGIYGYNQYDNIIYQLNVKKSFSNALNSIIKPLFEPITQQTVKFYENSELLTFYILTEENEYLKNKQTFFSLVKEMRNYVQYCLMIYKEQQTNLEAFGLTKEDLPAVIIVNEMRKYSLSKITPETLVTFVNKVLKNEAEPFFMSENEEEDSLIKKVTYKGRELFFNDTDKDRLIMFHAPWCQYCKILKPTLLDLANLVKNNDKFKIGTYDLTKNEYLLDFKVTGYPTLYLIKANSNEKIIFSNKTRDLKSISEFIKENSTNNLDFTELVEEFISQSKVKNAEEKEDEAEKEQKIEEEEETEVYEDVRSDL